MHSWSWTPKVHFLCYLANLVFFQVLFFSSRFSLSLQWLDVCAVFFFSVCLVIKGMKSGSSSSSLSSSVITAYSVFSDQFICACIWLIHDLLLLQNTSPSCSSPKSRPSRASFWQTTWPTWIPPKSPSSLKIQRRCKMWLVWALTWTPGACSSVTSSVVIFRASCSTTRIIDAFVLVSVPLCCQWVRNNTLNYLE